MTDKYYEVRYPNGDVIYRNDCRLNALRKWEALEAESHEGGYTVFEVTINGLVERQIR